MYNEELNYLVKNYLNKRYVKEVVDYIYDNTKYLDVSVDEGMPYFGVFYNETEDLLTGFTIVIPKVYDLKSMLINIHEFRHGIDLYPYLWERVPNKNFEQLAKNEEKDFEEYLTIKKLIKK